MTKDGPSTSDNAPHPSSKEPEPTRHPLPPDLDFNPQVFLVGAGPGHPGLLTLRAVECLAMADYVLYDKRVPESLLEHAPPEAEKVCVSELATSQKDRYLPIHETMRAVVSQGKRVVRLKGGDPFIFGRGGEEAEFLRKEGISFEVVPGVTAAVGATACTGIPLTHRAYASSLALVTGHEHPDKPESIVDWAKLAEFEGTIVVYMGLSRLSYIAKTLAENGKPPTTPAAVIQWGTTGHQITVQAPLDQLAEKVQNAGLISPALVVIGEVVGLRPEVSWFEIRPLFGKRILVTRPRKQAMEFAHRLEMLGAIPFVLPMVDVRELDDYSEVDRTIQELGNYDWLVFTSPNGVGAFLRRIWQLGKDMRTLANLRIAVIGPGTAKALGRYHLKPDFVAPVHRSEEFAEALKPLVKGQRVLLARANRGRDVLPQELSAVASNVNQISVYNQVDDVDQHSDIVNKLRCGEISHVTLTSENIARVFCQSLDEICRERILSGIVQLVTISPTTSEKVREFDLPVSAEAKVYSMDGVIAALIELIRE